MDLVVFRGTPEEAYALAEAIKNNCDCEAARRRCGPHTLMLSQQRLDALLFARFMSEHFVYEEFAER